ncbi:transposase [Streptomyces tirandamycinicus]|uniref:transposase n=1 Tax=Streptomyces tirandamycinicus TaxID=2174846 RepID=UPI003984585A
MGKAPPPAPGRTRRTRGVGLVPVRDRLCEHAGSEGGPDGSESRRSRQMGSKIHLITERSGLPHSIGISAANTHDSQGLEPLVRGIPPVRPHRGPRRRKPPNSMATRGTTTTTCAGGCAHGTSPRASRRGVESSQRLGRHRWTVERTVAWLAGCRRLHRRYQRKAAHFRAFAGIAAALICYRSLRRFSTRRDP